MSLQVDPQTKKISQVNCVDINSKRYFTLKSKLFVVSAGSIYTPHLLLNSSSPELPTGVSNSSGQVGRNLMIHPLGYAEGLFDDNLYSSFGPQGCCLYSHEFYNHSSANNFSLGYTFQSIRGPLPIESSISWLRRRYLKFSESFPGTFDNLFNHTAHLTVITHDLPSASNYISLSKDFDEYCSYYPSMSYSVTENTRSMLSHGLIMPVRFCRQPVQKTFVAGPVRETGWHPLGTCRMGEDPRSSVVNKYCLSHDHSNLFIVDGSVFPSSSGVNPCNTIQSISLYVSNFIINHFPSLVA